MFSFGMHEFTGVEHSVDLARAKIKWIHNQLFPGMSASTDWFKWYPYIDAHFFDDEPTRFYTAYKENDIVGLWCVEPKKLMVAGKEIPVGRCFAVGIHASQRRQGLFTDLSRYAIEEERKRGAYEYVLGFPQIGKPVVDAHLKAGWERVQEIDTHVFPTTDVLQFAETSTLYSARKITDFSPLRHAMIYENGFSETPTYKNDRWLCHPENVYTCLRKDDSAFIVLKQHGEKMHVLDITNRSMMHGSSTEGLLLCARNLAYKHGCKTLSMWCAENDPLLNVVTNLNKKLGTHDNGSWIDRSLSIDMLSVRITANASLRPRIRETAFSMGAEEGY